MASDCKKDMTIYFRKSRKMQKMLKLHNDFKRSVYKRYRSYKTEFNVLSEDPSSGNYHIHDERDTTHIFAYF